MKRALLNLLKVAMSIRHLLPVFLFTLGSFTLKAQCPPTVVTTPANTNICSGDSVLMACTPSSGVSWQWEKDGNPITGEIHSTFYAKEKGDYTVIISGCATPSDKITITLKALPIISLASDFPIICLGQQVKLTVTPGAGVNWLWFFPEVPNGSPPPPPDMSYVGKTITPLYQSPTAPTTYIAVGYDLLTGCTNSAKVTVKVDPPLVPGTTNSNQQICPGAIPALITSTAATGGSGTYIYQWQVRILPGGWVDIPGANDKTYQPGPTTQTTEYRLKVTSLPCQDEYSNVVVIQVNPNPTVTSPPTKSICSGDNVNYNPISNVAGATFTWTASATGGTLVSGFSASGSGNINDILSLPAGATISGNITYVITPLGPAPTNCPGISKNVVVTVNPIPSVTNAILSQDICAGTFSTPVILTSNVAGTTFSWTASGTAGLSGYQASGTGNIPAQQIFSILIVQGAINYTITPHGPAVPSCEGAPVVYTINVDPSPIVTNNPMQQTICTGDKTTVDVLTSNIVSTTFAWTATAVPATMTGFVASGTSAIPAQTIINNSTVQGVITYHIIPSNSPGGCIGIPNDYVVYVNPKPVASVLQSVVKLCSGTQTNIALTSNVAGTTFSWTVKNFGSITGMSDGAGNNITQTLYNNSNAPHPVEYDIIPSFNGCDGDKVTVTVIVNPKQILSIVPSNPTVCSGNNVTINLVGNDPAIAFTWSASTAGNVTGFSDGTGNVISQTLTNNDNITRTVVYAVTMELNSCSEGPVNFNVTVYPTPAVTNSPLSATRCSGTALNLALTSDVTGISYSWIANGIGTSGYSSGNIPTINQTVSTTSAATGTVTYTITPTANGCHGMPVDYILTVNPIPAVALSLANQSICSGTSTSPVTFTSAVAGTTYAWAAVPSGAGISGYTASGTTSIAAQVISSTLLIPGTVTYTVTPTHSGCTGPTASHLITINPAPVVNNASMSQTICSGATSPVVVLLSNVAGSTFSWTATPSSSAITGYQASGGNNIDAQTISNSGTTAGSVTYKVIPQSNYSPSCPGIPADYIINVIPNPSINSSLAESVCSGQPFNYTLTSNIAGSTFTWSRAAVSGISNPPVAISTMAGITETLLNTTNNDIDVTYVLTPFGQAPTVCAGIPKNLIVKVRALPLVNAGLDFTIPYGTYTTLNGTATGGTGALTYAWTPNSYINSGAGTLNPQTEKLTLTRTYSLLATDAAGCSANDPITVFVVGTPVTAAPTAVPASICLGQSTTVYANATGGSGTYTYAWTSVPAGFTATSASAAASPVVTTLYTVTVNDGFNSVSASVSVTVNPLPNKFVLTGGGSYCQGGSGVVVGLAGSQSGVTYQLYNNITPVGSPVSGSGAAISFGNQTLTGIYTVIATRISTGCTINMGSSVAVSINPLPVANAGADQTIPYGTNTTLSGSSTGGFGTINYTWTPLTFIGSGENTSTPNTTNLYSNTNFTLDIKDANGCTGSDKVLVSLNGNPISIAAASIPAEICADASTAQLPVSVTGGSGNYTFNWTCSPAVIPAWTSTAQNPIVSPEVTTTYTVTANDGFNTAVASVTVIVDPLPLQYSVTGGGSYCYAGNGVSIGLSGSQPNINYKLYRGGVADGPAITGTGSPISFGNRTAAFTYTVIATNNTTGCTNVMNGDATIIILSPPSAYLVIGGGSYPLGGIGREIGLFHGDAGVSYQLFCDNVAVGTPQTGIGSLINFGLQTQPGTYTIEGTDIATGCSVQMNASVNVSILPYPLVFDVYGGGIICDGQPGKLVHLSGSEISIDYQLLRNGFPYVAPVAGTNSPLTWGPFTVDGLFEVRSINTTVGITQMMNDSAVIIVHPAPTLYTINPTGTQCPGTIIRLNGSESGLWYILQYNGVAIDTITGTGVVGFLDYGVQTISGTYTVRAVNPITGCDAMMNGSTFISIAPKVFKVIPAGILCPGQTISLSGSETGVNYQLRWNGTFDLGSPVAGTGSLIIVGTAGLPGIYSAIATNATTNCVSYMNDSSTLYADPTAFTITPNATACEGDLIGLNGSEVGVDYVLLLDNAIHVDTIYGTGSPISFGAQHTAGNYTIIAINQTSYCIFPMNGATVMNDSPIKYALLPAGIQCIGTTISLFNSQAGITYQLLLDGKFNMGPAVAGTGSTISFGPQSLSGTYTVRAVNDLTGCNTFMSDSTVIEPLPLVFTTTPAGSHCSGASIGLNGSQINFNYILVLNGSVNLDTIAGTGNAIDFGAQFTGGDYSVIAYHTTTLCSNLMNGNSIIDTAPFAYAMTPSGIACIGSTLGIENSEPGINYQLRWNGSINVGTPVAGNGSAISFGTQNLIGNYTVIATNSNGCFSTMSSSVVINPLPVAFNVIPAGVQCQGTALGIDGSEVNVNYILVRNGNVMTDTIPGTGSTITFGPQLTSGNYTVVAFFASTFCQSAMNGSSVISNIAPTIYSMTPAGIICAGAIIGIDNSEIGASYQLRMNGTLNMGAPVAGTGSAINFGVQTLPGVYTAIATNLKGCSSMMSGSVAVNANPTAFNIIPSAGHCPGIIIGIDGSESGVNYILLLDNSIDIDTLVGTGSALSFGIQSTSGTYTVQAYNATTLCRTTMNGTTIINAAPIAFNMTPAGINCSGASIGLDNSEVGVNYQLRWNGNINTGTPIVGTGSAISFGTHTLTGTYTVIADNANGCVSTMNNSVIINPLPVAFNIIPSGMQCQGTIIGLDGTEVNANYVLVLNGMIMVDTLVGTGSSISFGPQMTSGFYSVRAFFPATHCQTVMNGFTIISSVAPTIYTMTPAGLICAGATLGLDNSEAGATYQLRLNGTVNIGAPVAGTGSAISFGVQTLPGVYTSIATNSNGCSSLMTGSVVVNPNPVAYTLTPIGAKCPGTVIGTNGSETGVNYTLVLDGSITIATLAGNGSALSFGAQATSGTYTILGSNALTLCQTLMNGTTVIKPAPLSFNLNPSGINCTGTIIGLDDTETSVIYQLRRDGITNVGAPLTGTGSAIRFGLINIPGTYTVIATSTVNGCGTMMNGTAVLQPLPIAYSIMTQGKQCGGTSVVLNGSQPDTDYVLVHDNTFNLDTIAGTGNMIDFGPQYTTGTYTIIAIGGTTTCHSAMYGFTQIQANPAAFNITPAGVNCGTAIAGLAGSETGVSYTLFKNGISTGNTVAGSGNAISFGTQLSGNFTVEAVNQTSNCKVFMPGILQISNPPSVNIGSDATICALQPVMINASVNNGGTANWLTSGGDGIFSNTGTLHPIYTPGVNDIAKGKVMLLLTVNGTGTCSTIKVIDTLNITIDKPATATAGGDIDVCIASDYTVHASATDYKIVTWSTSGTGNFANSGSVTPTYIPSAADLNAGSVKLSMLVTAKDACGNITSDDVMMTFHPIVTVNAGPGATISHFNTFTTTTASVVNSTSVQWSTNGSGSFDNTSNLNTTYTPGDADFVKGSVILTLTAFNQAPCSPVADTLTLKFINNWGIDYSWNPSCEATPVNFKVNPGVTNIGATAIWLWNFGDGTTSAVMNPTHLFPAIGEYDVSLTATDTLGHVKSVIHHVIVAQYPVSFFGSSIPNCSNELVNFNDLSHTLYGYIAEWIWNYGDGSANDTIQFPDQPNVSHLFNAAGTFNVTLSITNSFGCTTEKTLPVEVIEAPIANFQNVDYCSGLETKFRDASYANGPGNTVQYWWNFGDPSTGMDNYSDKKDATHIFSAQGTYQVMHVVRNFNNCTDTIVKKVIILDQIPVDFVHGFTCLDSKTSFGPDTTAMNTANVTNWEWDFGDGTTNNQQFTSHVYTQPGLYIVKLTVIDIAGCTASKTHNVIVNQLPVALFNTSQLPCANAPVHFDDVSNTYAGHIAKWNWDFGDGNSKQILNPTNPDTDHTYSASGIYTVKLSITSNDGCTAISQQTIVINPAPVANFDYTNSCQSTPVQFNDLSQASGAGMLTSWSWNFGDGTSGKQNTSVLQNPTHTYAKTGTYNISLTVVTTNGCSSVLVKTVKIAIAPFVDFSYDKRCEDAVIQFSPTAGVIAAGVAKWDWSYGDGSTSTQINPQHAYNTAGNYNVTLIITNTAGCQNTISHNLSILPAPIAKFKTNAVACSQRRVVFINQSSDPAGNIVRWEYNFGDGTNTIVNYPANPNVSHAYAVAGTFTASLTVVTENGCSATTSQSIQILPSPLANFSTGASCLGSAVQFNDLSQGNVESWAWDFGNPGSGANNTSTQQNPSHTYLNEGNFEITLHVENGNGCSNTYTRTLNISAKPTTDFSFNSGCASDTVHFNSSAYVDVASTSSYFWNFGDKSISVDANPYHIYAAPGIYFVSLTLTNKNGCTNVKTRKVQVTTAPTAMFTHSSLSCLGTAVLFTDFSSTTGGVIESWNWNFDDGTSLTVNSPENPNVTHTFAVAGFYEVTLTIRTSTGCYASHTSSIKINTAPETAFTYANGCNNTPTLFTDNTQSAGGYAITGWSWNFGDPASGINNSSATKNPQHTFSSEGTYNVTLTTENSAGCTNSVTHTINTNPLKNLNFTQSSACKGTSATLSVDTTVIKNADISAYLWNFGDGTPASTLAHPSHLFPNSGNYKVTLTITQLSGCQSSVTKNVTINNWPVAQFTNTGNCAANKIEFTDMSFSSDGEKMVAWAWDFGANNTNADTSSSQNPSFSYAAEGTYNVKLTVTTASGCTAEKIMQVVVIAAPTAVFSYAAEPCHNGSVLFMDKSVSSQSMINGWKWEFAPDVYSTMQNPVYVFGDTDTSYYVKLIVSMANGCTNTVIQKVSIPSSMKVAINYTQACFGETTWFSSTLVEPVGGTITSYKWNFGDAASGYKNESKLANPQHTFSKPGTYVISLNAIDLNNCSTTKFMRITVDALPKSAFSYTGGACDSLVKFKDMTAGIKIVRWTWKFGDGKSKVVDAPANSNVTHYYAYPGIYEATLITESEAGCYDTVTNNVRRTPCIRAAFAVKSPVVCQKRSIQFTETSECQAPIASWQWFFGDGTSETFTSPQVVVQHTYAKAGSYNVKMVVASQMVGGLATDTAHSQVAVNPAAKAAYAFQDACSGNTTEFANLSQNNNTTIKSYLWNFGNSGSVSDTTAATNPKYNYKLAGEYNVKLVVTNTLGCTDTLAKKVTIFASPAADFHWSADCEAKPVYFTDNSEGASSAITNWNWKFSSEAQVLDATSKKSCSVSFAHAGTYDANLKVTDRNGCATLVSKQITIKPSPVAAFNVVDNYESKQGQIMINNGTINGTDYEWDFGNGKTSSADAPTVTFDREGHYTIQLIAWNGPSCADTLTMAYDLMFKGLYVPNALNPGNMDPEVAVFKPKGVNLKLYLVEIYDRWGILLWSSTKIDSKGSPSESWDGTLHGEVLKEDVYVWKILAQFNDGEVWDGTNSGNNENMPQKKSGTVTLIR